VLCRDQSLHFALCSYSTPPSLNRVTGSDPTRGYWTLSQTIHIVISLNCPQIPPSYHESVYQLQVSRRDLFCTVLYVATYPTPSLHHHIYVLFLKFNLSFMRKMVAQKQTKDKLGGMMLVNECRRRKLNGGPPEECRKLQWFADRMFYQTGHFRSPLVLSGMRMIACGG
jgi:hypothetical protein